MIVYEFFLKEPFKSMPFEDLCDKFYKLGPAFTRKVDGETASAVYSISRNPVTGWVQLLIDDNAPQAVLTSIENDIKGKCDEDLFQSRKGLQDNVAPMERPRVKRPV